MADPVYKIDESGQPQMEESFLIFIDILGYRDMVRSASSPEQQASILARLHTALSRHVPVLQHVEPESSFDGPPWYASKVFTDNIVLARPLFKGPLASGESELGHMMLDAGYYQLNLALEGFYVRGGIAVGPAYVDDHVVFGPALLEAYDLEHKHAVYPRIILSEGAKDYVRKHVGYYTGGAQNAPHNHELLVDDDGVWFVNYLDAPRLDDDPDLLAFYEPAIRQHRDGIVTEIGKHAANRRVLDKYTWVGRYHNYSVSYLYPNRPDLLVPVHLVPHGFQRLADVIE